MTPSSESIPSLLLASLYSVLDNQNHWPEFLHGFCDFVGTAYASVVSLTFHPSPELLQFFKWGLTDEDLRQYCTLWMARDPWVKGQDLSALVPGVVACSTDFCSDEELDMSEAYVGFLKPRNLHYGASVLLLRSDRIGTVLSTLRSKDCGPLTSEELNRIASLVPHLQRVLRIHDETGDLVTKLGFLRGLFDLSAVGFLLLDQRGALLTANSRARAVLDRAVLLFTENGKLRSPCRSCDEALREAIRRALDPFDKTSGGEVVLLGNQPPEDEHAGPQLRLLVVPAHRGEPLAPSSVSPAVIVHIIDRAALPRIDRETLRKVFSLSKAEAAVAVNLACGLSVAEMAESLHVSHHTVRSHLKTLFLKTETTQQSALVSLILRLQSPLDSGGKTSGGA